MHKVRNSIFGFVFILPLILHLINSGIENCDITREVNTAIITNDPNKASESLQKNCNPNEGVFLITQKLMELFRKYWLEYYAIYGIVLIIWSEIDRNNSKKCIKIEYGGTL